MGKILRFISRTIGTPGTTARWAAAGFWDAVGNKRFNLKKMESEKGLEKEVVKFCKSLINKRMQLTNRTKYKSIAEEKKILLKQFSETSGLLGLCVSVLKVEADLHKNTPEAIKDMVDVMYEELVKKGVGEKIIFGDGMVDAESEWTFKLYYAFSATDPTFDYEKWKEDLKR